MCIYIYKQKKYIYIYIYIDCFSLVTIDSNLFHNCLFLHLFVNMS